MIRDTRGLIRRVPLDYKEDDDSGCQAAGHTSGHPYIICQEADDSGCQGALTPGCSGTPAGTPRLYARKLMIQGARGL
ncbi:hypothetical protein XENTR_v10007187 [Xenopus tropicalis]|nr:hypothetical protein XENTR_v10007187 [Xenopus tropicalis]